MASSPDILSIDEDIRKKIDSQQLQFYISDTLDIIERYKTLLKTPRKVNFMGEVSKNPLITKEDNELIDKYLKITRKYSFDCEPMESQKNESCCHNCNEILKFIILDDTNLICTNCSSEQNTCISTISYADTERINISSKFSYDRKTHFRECINQYHGKQNVAIPQKLYDDLMEKFDFHRLLVEGSTPNERCQNINKKTVMTFLKELGYTKQYENVNLIYTNMTGKKLDDISYINERILCDFDILSELYDKQCVDKVRKNFINTQYVLFQLLRRNGHPCKKEDFSNLKTIDRKFFHENIMKALFEELGWNYTSIL